MCQLAVNPLQARLWTGGKADRLAGHRKIVVVKRNEYEAVKYAVVEIMLNMPLNLTRHSETEDESYYND